MNLKKCVVNFWKENSHKGKKFVAKHFLEENIPKSTVYRLIKCAEQGEAGERRVGSGRPIKIATKSNIRYIKNFFNNSSGKSQKQLAYKLNCSRQHVSGMIKKYTSIKIRKRTGKPKRTDLQLKRMRPKCRKLYQKYKNHIFILDDESYFTLSNSTLAGNDRYYTDDVKSCPEHVKHKLKSKFEEKLLVWIAVSSEGMSKPWFVPSKMAINSTNYLSECIERRLLPFLRLHKNKKIVFWPDLASSHYAKIVISFLDSEKVKYVAKSENPASVPEARPIEDFWADLKRQVYKGNWQAKNLTQLKTKIERELKKYPLENLRARMSETGRRLDRIARNGID